MTVSNAAPFSIMQDGGLNKSLTPKEQARQSAEQFETIFLNQMLSNMFEGIGEGDMFGGSYAQDTYRGLLTETYADEITKAGGIGIAESVMRELINMQEAEQ